MKPDLQVGKPLQFEKNETHSFSEWLQLSKISPIVRDEEEKNQKCLQVRKKFDLIERFIETGKIKVSSKILRQYQQMWLQQ